MGAIGALKTFDVVYLTTGGGPGRATELMATYIFKKSIVEFDAGYSAALSIVLLVLALVITLMQAAVVPPLGRCPYARNHLTGGQLSPRNSS